MNVKFIDVQNETIIYTGTVPRDVANCAYSIGEKVDLNGSIYRIVDIIRIPSMYGIRVYFKRRKQKNISRREINYGKNSLLFTM